MQNTHISTTENWLGAHAFWFWLRASAVTHFLAMHDHALSWYYTWAIYKKIDKTTTTTTTRTTRTTNAHIRRQHDQKREKDPKRCDVKVGGKKSNYCNLTLGYKNKEDFRWKVNRFTFHCSIVDLKTHLFKLLLAVSVVNHRAPRTFYC